MRSLSLTCMLLVSSAIFLQAHPQSILGTLHDFEDGETQFWSDCIDNSTTPPVVIATDGPSGDGDHYLRNEADGSDSCTGYFYTTGSPDFENDWTGVAGIQMDVRAVGADFNMRIVIQDNLQGFYYTTNAIFVANGSGWNRIVIPVAPSDFTPLTGTQDINTVLTNVTEASIVSNTDVSTGPDFGVGAIHLDNIEAVGTLGVEELFNPRTVKLSPIPAHGNLNVILPASTHRSSYEIFDILGKRIKIASFEGAEHSIDVHALDKGVYVLKLLSDERMVIKRFIKD